MKLWLIIALIGLFGGNSFASNSTQISQEVEILGKIVIENFEVKDFSQNPNWWRFGDSKITVVSSPAIDKYAVSISGKAINWFVGGIGLYIADPFRDISKYSSITLDVYSKNPKNGKLKIELYDDDNGNWQIEQDPKNEPLFDDRFVYELNIDWQGWKHLTVPFTEFVDNNPNIGDNIWNPNLYGNSRGLIQIQFITVASSKGGSVDLVIDNIGFGENGDRK